MISFYYGTNTAKSRERAREAIDSFCEKHPGAQVFTADAESFLPVQAEELARGESLFGEERIALFEGVFQNKEYADILRSFWGTLLSSPTHFIFIEEELPDNLPKGGEYSENKKPAKGRGDYNPFGLADAFGKRDKKGAWTLYREAVEEGNAFEEIHGILFWQVKAMKLASLGKSAAGAGLSPFVYAKSAKYAKNFSPEELEQILVRLMSVYHESHRGQGSFETNLEKFILENL